MVFAPAVLVLVVVVAMGAPRGAQAQEGGEVPDLTAATCAFVDTSGIFQVAIGLACGGGLISGCGGDRFCPREYVMREDMAVYLEKLLRNPDSGQPFAPPVPTADPFTDVPKTYPFAGWINQLEPTCDAITAGCGNNAF